MRFPRGVAPAASSGGGPRALLGPFELSRLVEDFRRQIPLAGLEPHLRGVLEDVLGHPGSLVRAQLAYGILREHGVDEQTASRTAIALEDFHTASLLFDDMPMMDDAAERRGHPCPHVVHGEAAASLGALALINQGYALLWRVLGDLPRTRRRMAAELVGECLGAAGILNGQSLDLHFDRRTGSAEEVMAVAEGKTATLIRLTLLLPAWIAGVGSARRRRLDRLASVWGLAYQTLDDFKDVLMNESETGKSPRRDQQLGRPNLPGLLGTDAALERLDALLAEGRELVDRIIGRTRRFTGLERVREILDGERAKIAAKLGEERRASVELRACA